MAFRERIDLLINVTTGQAQSAVRRLKSDLATADGAFAKTKVASGALWDSLKVNAGTAALAAGGALAGFAVKAVGDFQKVALGAGQLRDSLGVTAEEASRLQEVATDLGIPVGALESTIGRMNRTASSTPGHFDAIGASIVRNADGTTNVTETFLSVVDALNAMPDATKRAEAAQKIFGRSWQDIAELIGEGAEGVREALASVEEQKIINDDEVAKARKFRDTMDELKGMVESATIALGQGLVPVIGTVTDALIVAKDAVTNFQDALPQDAQDAGFDIFTTGGQLIEDFKFNFGVLKDTVTGGGAEIKATFDNTSLSIDGMDASVTQATGSVTGMDAIMDIAAGSATIFAGEIDVMGTALGNAEAQMDGFEGATYNAERAARNLQSAWDRLKGEISEDQAWIDLQNQFDRVEQAGIEAYTAAVNGSANAEQAARDHQSEINQLKLDVINYGSEVMGLPEKQVTDILADIDHNSVDAAKRAIGSIPSVRYVDVRVRYPTINIPPNVDTSGIDAAPSGSGKGGMAAGSLGRPPIPGSPRRSRRGPGLVWRGPPLRSSNGGTAGSQPNVIINAPYVDPRYIQRQQTLWSRRNAT